MIDDSAKEHYLYRMITSITSNKLHDDIMTRKPFPHHWLLIVLEIPRSPAISHHCDCISLFTWVYGYEQNHLSDFISIHSKEDDYITADLTS